MKKDDLLNVALFYDWRDVSRKYLSSVYDCIRKDIMLSYMNEVACVIRDDFGLTVDVPGKVGNFSGLVSLFAEDKEDLVKPFHYVLSEDRIYVPKVVRCSDRDYSVIEDVLRIERGDSAELVRGFTGWFFNERHLRFFDKV
jgi:hypothetical protein